MKSLEDNLGHSVGQAGGIGDLMHSGVDSAITPIVAFVGSNLGYPTLTAQIPMRDFFRISAVANEAENTEDVSQRKLDPTHARKLALYILKGLVGAAIRKKVAGREEVPLSYLRVQRELLDQPYQALQPIVANIRAAGPGGRDLQFKKLVAEDGSPLAVRVFLRQNQILWVIDGQHRRWAMDQVFKFLELSTKTLAYHKNGLYENGPQVSTEEHLLWLDCLTMASGDCKVNVDLHLGLDVRQERQLFHDMNQLGKKVETSLALRFDQSNPLTVFANEMAGESILNISEHEQTDWANDDGALALKDFVGVNSILFLGNSNVKRARASNITAEKKAMARRFWQAVAKLDHFGTKGARLHTVAAQPVMLKGLAKVLFDLAFSNRADATDEERQALVETFFRALPNVNFKHSNKAWLYYHRSASQRAADGVAELAGWLPDEKPGVNRDIGSLQDKSMRFGAKHNDIYPLLGDMVRWSMGLPSRHAAKAKKAKNA
jgi:hypothetical protein